ncbi:hypothetical protein M1O57_03150 [Dehalococcoidia bacterium]|nr:hypothetical protein [Dehalococcoidia bacterium]
MMPMCAGEDVKWWLAQTTGVMETLKRLYFVFVLAMAERVKVIEAGVSVALPGGE